MSSSPERTSMVDHHRDSLGPLGRMAAMVRGARSAVTLTGLLAVAGCAFDPALPPKECGTAYPELCDASQPDSRERDGGVVADTGVVDSGELRDAGSRDAGSDTPEAGVDAGERDGGLVDAGEDAGPRDSGPRDGGQIADTGVNDSGVVDAGDAGVVPSDPMEVHIANQQVGGVLIPGSGAQSEIDIDVYAGSSRGAEARALSFGLDCPTQSNAEIVAAHVRQGASTILTPPAGNVAGINISPNGKTITVFFRTPQVVSTSGNDYGLYIDSTNIASGTVCTLMLNDDGTIQGPTNLVALLGGGLPNIVDDGNGNVVWADGNGGANIDANGDVQSGGQPNYYQGAAIINPSSGVVPFTVGQ